MLHLIPAPIHRQLYRIADLVRRRWWRIRRPWRSSVCVVAFDGAGRILLVRHSYGRPVWAVPGGGVGRREDPAKAAAREFLEELGSELSSLTLVESRQQEISGSRDTVNVFAARLAGDPRPDMREIVALDFFDPANLPPDCSPLVPRQVGSALKALESGVFTLQQR